MPRQPRYRIAGFPQHIVQRGNDRQATFRADDDFRLYRRYLAESAAEQHCAVHAYCLMGNHVHLLVTPLVADAIGKLMQSIGRRYVCWFNHRYGRTGTLWEGRYRASLVDDDSYVLACYRYIELNPVRADIAATPAAYAYSSFRRNALGEADVVIREHDVYTALAATPRARSAAYRRLFTHNLSDAQLERIRLATHGCRTVAGDVHVKRGRPKKGRTEIRRNSV